MHPPGIVYSVIVKDTVLDKVKEILSASRSLPAYIGPAASKSDPS